MVKYRLQLRSVQNVGDSKTALIDIPCGQRFHYIELILGYANGTNTIAGAAAHITDLRVLSNSRVQRQVTGVELRDMNLLNGAAYDCQGTPNASPGVSFPIFFAEPWRDTPADQDALAWSTAGWLSFQIQVTLSAAIAGSGTPTLEAYAVTDDFVPATKTNPGIVKWIRSELVPGGNSYSYPSLDRIDWLQQISIYPDTTNSREITQVTFKKNGMILHELTHTANTVLLTNHGMNPVTNRSSANIYDLVFDHDGLLSSAVPTDGSRDLLLTIQAADVMAGKQVAIIQRLGPPE